MLGILCNIYFKRFIVIIRVCLLCIMSVGMHADILDTEDKSVELVYLYAGSQGGTQACLAVT